MKWFEVIEYKWLMFDVSLVQAKSAEDILKDKDHNNSHWLVREVVPVGDIQYAYTLPSKGLLK